MNSIAVATSAISGQQAQARNDFAVSVLKQQAQQQQAIANLVQSAAASGTQALSTPPAGMGGNVNITA